MNDMDEEKKPPIAETYPRCTAFVDFAAWAAVYGHKEGLTYQQALARFAQLWQVTERYSFQELMDL